MAANATPVPDYCYADWYNVVGTQIEYTVHYIASPFYFLFSLFGQSVFLWFCVSQLKSDNAYVYQILVTIGEMNEVVCMTAYVVLNGWLGGHYFPAPAGWSSCYACMWMSAHLALPLNRGSISMSQFLTISMGIDRFRALYWPFQYKPAEKIGYFYITLLCLTLSIGLSGYEFFKGEIIPLPDGTYKIDFYSTDTLLWAVIGAQFRQAGTIAAILVLIFLNFSIPTMFWRSLQKSKNVINDAAQKQRMRTARMLIIFSTCATVLAVIAEWSQAGLRIYGAVCGPCFLSQVTFAIAIADLVFFCSTGLKFYAMFAFNRDFRVQITSRFRQRFGISSVAPAVNTPSSNPNGTGHN